MLRLVATSLLLFAALALPVRADGPLLGRIDGDIYVSPTGAFTVRVPVLPDLGGSIADTENVVTFRDTYTTHISLAAFPQDATQRWLLSTSTPKEYLKSFFEKYVLRDFAQNFKNAQIETNARFLPGIFDGAFIAYVLLPGGSMFTDRVEQVSDTKPPPVAKRGNMIFVKNGFVFIISTELAERVTEGSAYKKTAEEEDIILRKRLVDFAQQIVFLKPTPAAAATR